MAQPLARPDLSDLSVRVLSAAVLMPLSLAAIWWGGWYFGMLVALLACAMSWEWSSLCHAKAATVILLFATVIMSAMLTFGGAYREMAVCIAAGALLVAIVSRISGEESSNLLPAGTVYLSLGIVSVIWVRIAEVGGLEPFLWMVAVVIATDVGAYFAGRFIGGPKMAPRISPGKTWSGMAGGAVGAALAGLITVHIVGNGNYAIVGLLSAAMAFVAQGGDLIESSLKRHFGVKDAGNIIPGHGGALDRFDGFLTVAPVMALMTWTAGRSPLEWQ